MADGVTGVTSNPSIFGKTIGGSTDYDEEVDRIANDGGDPDALQVFEDLAIVDIQMAADVLRPLYDSTAGADGFVSFEVEPRLARDTAGTIEAARRLWARIERPNVLIKIPGTAEGLQAIEQAIADGINVNVTLLFAVDAYSGVAAAYQRGIERRVEAGRPVDRIASVASFFVSRVDSAVDARLPEGSDLRGTAAIANAKLAYEAFNEIFGGDEFADLRAAGATVQRCLWASTSTKNPDYRDVLYVEELIGPDTVDTMPIETIEAFLDHGNVRRTLDRGIGDAHQAIREVEASGISMDRVTDELIAEGVASFAKSFDELIETIESKRRELAPA
jgi:transaldolase